MKQPSPISWTDVETRLPNLLPVKGGYSQAQRGLLELDDDNKVFVKAGTDDNTKKWARKEIAVYRFLQRQKYPNIPNLLSVNNDETAFALEALLPGDGWNWNEDWNTERLNATFQALDELQAIMPQGNDRLFFSTISIGNDDNGWVPLLASAERQAILLRKLRKAGQSNLADSLNIAANAKQSECYVFATNQLVHYDMRGDNCAWNPRHKEVRIVDWNWTQLGDRRLEIAAMLIHVERSGMPLTSEQLSLIDINAVQWLAGLWLNAAATPIWPGGPEILRDVQLQAGIVALDLVARLSD